MNWPDDYINKVICGDCLDVMRSIPDGAVDLVLTDPPYGIGLDYGVGVDDSSDAWNNRFLDTEQAEMVQIENAWDQRANAIARALGVGAVAFMNTSREKCPIHTSLDWLDKVDPDELAMSAGAVCAVVEHLLGE